MADTETARRVLDLDRAYGSMDSISFYRTAAPDLARALLASQAQVAALTEERDEAKRSCRNALDNYTNVHRTTRCVACEGRGGTLDAGGNVIEACDACGGTGGEVDRLTRRLATAEKWKASAENVGLQATTRAMKAESDRDAARASVAELVVVARKARQMIASSGPTPHPYLSEGNIEAMFSEIDALIAKHGGAS